MNATAMAASAGMGNDPAYGELESIVADQVAAISLPLFTTNASGLFEMYLEGIAPEHRQHYNCHCCRRFIERYGGLVMIDPASGKKRSALWDDIEVPEFFRQSVLLMNFKLVESRVTGVFVNPDKSWGIERTGDWTHLHGTPAVVFSSPLKTAHQEQAEKLQDYIHLRKALEDYSLDAAAQAVRVLDADVVDRSEKTLGVAKWFLELHQRIAGVRGPVRDQFIWLAVASAPVGWCHIRSTMISTLLDDIIAGLPFHAIESRWNAKVHPLQYQRPTTVKDGNLEQANRIVAKLQSEGALQRRFARLDEVVALWRPRIVPPSIDKPNGRPFDHLRADRQTVKPVDLPPQSIAWPKFRDTVLPDANKVEVLIQVFRQEFFGLVTAENPDAPPLLQWDQDGRRNPVSWYFYHGGSYAEHWNLAPGWKAVDAICLKPCYWLADGDQFKHQGPGVFFVIRTAKDMRYVSGAGFFPEFLRSEYHEIRHAMEAYAKTAVIGGRDDGTANGIALSGNKSTPLIVRVYGEHAYADYALTIE